MQRDCVQLFAFSVKFIKQIVFDILRNLTRKLTYYNAIKTKTKSMFVVQLSLVSYGTGIELNLNYVNYVKLVILLYTLMKLPVT